jgi:PLP dependent protein
MDGKSLEVSFNQVREQIRAAAKKVSRDPNSIKLLAVSKKQPDEKIRCAMQVGQKDFAENYVQELLPRLEKFPTASWHFIGGLQRNKCKQVVGRVALIHSVDREELAAEINKIAERGDYVQNILVQVNMGSEESKGGVEPEQLHTLLDEIRLMKNIDVKGLMALPPMTDDLEDSRPFFRELKKMGKIISSNCELSMGTSHDFTIAVEEGATIVRVGTSLFGARE